MAKHLSDCDVFTGLNILICTPGRLLQHMDETPNFDSSAVQILVLDEADRILDMVSLPSHDTICSLESEFQKLHYTCTNWQATGEMPVSIQEQSIEYAYVVQFSTRVGNNFSQSAQKKVEMRLSKSNVQLEMSKEVLAHKS